jgi:hypothetical protein
LYTWQWSILFLAIALCIAVFFWWTRVRVKSPQLNANWQGDCEHLPQVSIQNNNVTINNFRDFTWRTVKDRDEIWTTRSVNVNELKNIWYIVDHFHSVKALAHSMLSFEFNDGNFLVASFETRRKKGQRYSPWQGLWRAYELYLVWGSERDLIGLRTNVRNNKVHLYQVVTPPGKDKALFLELCHRTQQLATEPEWYHSISTTCLTSIVHQVNQVTPNRIPMTWRYLLPGHSARAAFRLGLIEDWGGYQQTTQLGRIQGAQDLAKEADFSQQIRQNLPQNSRKVVLS